MKLARLFLAWIFAVGALHADGGAILFQKEGATLRATVFGSPAPLSAGVIDFSVLLQDASGKPILSYERLHFLLEPLELNGERGYVPPCCSMETSSADREIPVERATSGNRLLYKAYLVVPQPGKWRLQVRIPNEETVFSGTFEVFPAQSAFALFWPAVFLPVAGVVLYGINRAIKRNRSAV